MVMSLAVGVPPGGFRSPLFAVIVLWFLTDDLMVMSMEFDVPTPAPANAPLNPVPEEAAMESDPASASA